MFFLSEPAGPSSRIPSTLLPVTDGDSRAPGLWSQLRAARIGPTGDETVGRLQAAHALERALARRFTAAARGHGSPRIRAGLLALAERADHSARRLAAALGELGGRVLTPGAGATRPATDPESLGTDVDVLRAATERYLDDACAVARDHPWLARLLLTIRDDRADDLRELVRLRATLGADDPDDADSAPVPAVVTPEPGPAAGRAHVQGRRETPER